MANESWGKLYERTFTGSMYGAGPAVFAVWAYAIAHMRPPDGQVELNPAMLAGIIGCPVAEIAAALDLLTSADANSRSPDEDGKRLLKIGAFDYVAVNFAKYREGRQPAERTEQNREAQRRFRARNPKSKPPSAQAEAEAEAENQRPLRSRARKPVDNSANADWIEFRHCISAAKKPDSEVLQAVALKLGGMDRLGAMTTYELDRKRADFDAARGVVLAEIE